MTLEVTGDPVTEGRVESLLGWLGPATGGTADIPFNRMVEMGDFIRRGW